MFNFQSLKSFSNPQFKLVVITFIIIGLKSFNQVLPVSLKMLKFGIKKIYCVKNNKNILSIERKKKFKIFGPRIWSTKKLFSYRVANF